MKRLEVIVLGQSYLLTCPDDGEPALVAAAARVDREMSAIRDAGKLKARERIAVLASLNLAFELSSRVEPTGLPSEAAPRTMPASSPEDAARIDQLIARIDEVLADDGRLL